MNKNFLITGATSGLGEKFSLLIADIAKNIIIVGRSKKRLLKLKKKLILKNPEISIEEIEADLSTTQGLNKLFKKFKSQKKIRFIDVLVNSAANLVWKK